MPTPIPDWDLARRLVKFVANRQLNGQETTLKMVSHTLGIGRERIEKILVEKEITGMLKVVGEKPSGDDLLFIQYVPRNLAIDALVSPTDLELSYIEIVNNARPARAVRQRRMSRKQLDTIKVKEFWTQEK